MSGVIEDSWRLEIRDHKSPNQQRVFEVWDDDEGEEHTRPLGVARGRNSSMLKWEFELLKSCAQFQGAAAVGDRQGRLVVVVTADNSRDAVRAAARRAASLCASDETPALAVEYAEPLNSFYGDGVMTSWKVDLAVVPATIFAAARAFKAPSKRCEELQNGGLQIIPGAGMPAAPHDPEEDS